MCVKEGNTYLVDLAIYIEDQQNGYEIKGNKDVLSQAYVATTSCHMVQTQEDVHKASGIPTHTHTGGKGHRNHSAVIMGTFEVEF